LEYQFVAGEHAVFSKANNREFFMLNREISGKYHENASSRRGSILHSSDIEARPVSETKPRGASMKQSKEFNPCTAPVPCQY
jgi:hypothetical protein